MKEIFEVTIEKKKPGAGCLMWVFWGLVILCVLTVMAGKK